MRAVLLITIAVLSASAQTPDYARAESFLITGDAHGTPAEAFETSAQFL